MIQRLAPLVIAAVTMSAWGGEPPAECGRLENHFGPFDYRKVSPHDERLANVERNHFTAEVESLKGGSTARFAVGDISYTLGAFPNHPRALAAMMKWGLMNKTDRPKGTRYTVTCWFERARAFQPDDSAVLAIYATYKYYLNKSDESVRLFEEAIAAGADGTDVHYNLGLAYFAAKRYDMALKEAHIAYGRGFYLPGLKSKLKSKNAWQEPSTAPPVEKVQE